jgi:hypothetical protein
MGLLIAFALLAGATDAAPAATTTRPATVEQAVLIQFDYGSKDWAPFF